MAKSKKNGSNGHKNYNTRCDVCGRLVKDPENIPGKEKFKATFTPRIHGHGASNHGSEPEMNEIATRERRERNGQKGDL
jgi:hypothetical protein